MSTLHWLWCSSFTNPRHELVSIRVYLVRGEHSRYSDWLRAGRSGDRIPVGARLSAPVQIGPGTHPPSCTMGTGSFPRVKSSRGVTLTPHHLLVPWSWKGRAIPLLPLWAVRSVQSLRACTRVHFTLFFLPILFILFLFPVYNKYATIHKMKSNSTHSPQIPHLRHAMIPHSQRTTNHQELATSSMTQSSSPSPSSPTTEKFRSSPPFNTTHPNYVICHLSTPRPEYSYQFIPNQQWATGRLVRPNEQRKTTDNTDKGGPWWARLRQWQDCNRVFPQGMNTSSNIPVSSSMPVHLTDSNVYSQQRKSHTTPDQLMFLNGISCRFESSSIVVA